LFIHSGLVKLRQARPSQRTLDTQRSLAPDRANVQL